MSMPRKFVSFCPKMSVTDWHDFLRKGDKQLFNLKIYTRGEEEPVELCISWSNPFSSLKGALLTPSSSSCAEVEPGSMLTLANLLMKFWSISWAGVKSSYLPTQLLFPAPTRQLSSMCNSSYRRFATLFWPWWGLHMKFHMDAGIWTWVLWKSSLLLLTPEPSLQACVQILKYGVCTHTHFLRNFLACSLEDFWSRYLFQIAQDTQILKQLSLSKKIKLLSNN